MVDGGGGNAFPVVFFDGEREMNIGSVNIDGTMQYKSFQLMLSHKIGISPNQISIYLVDQKRNSKFEDRRRIPITGKVNFALISREKDCCFLVVLKRSRKSRNRRVGMNGLEFADFLPENDYTPEPVLVFLNPPSVCPPPPRRRQPTAILTANPPIFLYLSSKFINVRPPTAYLSFRFPASISTSSSAGLLHPAFPTPPPSFAGLSSSSSATQTTHRHLHGEPTQ
ncbi:Uncharacterized protein Fot_51935 [Forsythia ovata]|uniref:DUF7138 domain-containing protein n=1 Tax=Forsythia ovata TaxID=205694 RepID=A0ABD1PK29_9LAMI